MLTSASIDEVLEIKQRRMAHGTGLGLQVWRRGEADGKPLGVEVEDLPRNMPWRLESWKEESAGAGWRP